MPYRLRQLRTFSKKLSLKTFSGSTIPLDEDVSARRLPADDSNGYTHSGLGRLAIIKRTLTVSRQLLLRKAISGIGFLAILVVIRTFGRQTFA